MSRSRQTTVKAEWVLRIQWPEEKSPDTKQLEKCLKAANDGYQKQIRVDCHRIPGVPRELVEILRNAKSTADRRGKELHLDLANHELCEAVFRDNGNESTPVKRETAADAAESHRKEARSASHEQKKESPLRRYALMTAIILLAVALVALAGYWYTDVRPPTIKKSFEGETIPTNR